MDKKNKTLEWICIRGHTVIPGRKDCQICKREWKRAWTAANREKVLVQGKRSRDKRKAAMREYLRARRQDLNVRARKAIENALKDGRMTRPSNCSECGAGGRIHGHHEDYSKKFEVIWLCCRCHGLRHRKDKP